MTNTIGNPLKTAIALSQLISEGTLDHFSGLKICAIWRRLPAVLLDRIAILGGTAAKLLGINP